MARRKGKSQRRIKDWYSRFVGGDEDGGVVERKQKLSSQRAVKLPPARLDADADRDAVGLEDLPNVRGMIVGFFPGGAVVRAEGHEMLCGVAKTFRAPDGSSAMAVGDDVTVALTHGRHTGAADADRDRADGMILSREPRRTVLARPRPQSGKFRDAHGDETFEKVIVANMDALLIVAATRRPPLRHGLIDRFLIIAERGELAPVLVINKIDLGRPDESVLHDLDALGIEIVFCSAASAEGLDRLRAVLASKRSVLAGASGVGKTTLINAMLPGVNAMTRTVSAKDNRGRHATTAATVYDLPCGGIIVDTPGIRELGMKFDADELPWYFPEFEAVAADCRFNDCTHTHEPGCAVRAGVESGTIGIRRYNSYLRLLETLDER